MTSLRSVIAGGDGASEQDAPRDSSRDRTGCTRSPRWGRQVTTRRARETGTLPPESGRILPIGAMPSSPTIVALFCQIAPDAPGRRWCNYSDRCDPFHRADRGFVRAVHAPRRRAVGSSENKVCEKQTRSQASIFMGSGAPGGMTVPLKIECDRRIHAPTHFHGVRVPRGGMTVRFAIILASAAAVGSVSSRPRVSIRPRKPPFWQVLGSFCAFRRPASPAWPPLWQILGSFRALGANVTDADVRDDRTDPLYPCRSGFKHALIVSELSRNL